MSIPSEQAHSPRHEALESVNKHIIDNKLWLKILIGMALGVIAGLLLSPQGAALYTDNQQAANVLGEWIALPGVLFLGLIQMVVVPLVTVSIILGINSSHDLGFVKSISLKIVPYFLITTAVAIGIGIILTQLIQPGSGVDQSFVDNTMNSGVTNDTLPNYNLSELSIPERFNNMIPTNIAEANLNKNMLQIVIAAILIGAALISIPTTTSEPLIRLCTSIQIVGMKIIDWAMKIAPIAVFGLLCNIIIRSGFDAITSIGLYSLTVVLGLICVMIMYMLIVKILGKVSLSGFLLGIREAQLIAFSTSSSAATMPVSISAAEAKLDVKPSVSRFIVPLGATINMDGTAMYQAVAALFLCQIFGIDLSTGEMLLLLVTTVGASIGTPATPGVGIVVLATILTGIGIPAEGIALILGVDRLLDMCRTTVNVTGDLTATVVMNRLTALKPQAQQTG